MFNTSVIFSFVDTSTVFVIVFFMPTSSKSGGHIVLSCLSFCHSVITPFCHSVLLSETLTFQITFEQLVLELRYLTWIFPCVPLFFTLWPWPWSMTYFLKTLTLLITFEQWVLRLWYFTWIFPVIRPFYGYHYFFYPVTLTLKFDTFSENLNLANNFLTMSARAFRGFIMF